MAPRGKRGKFKQWLLSFFPEKGEVRYLPEGPHHQAASGGLFGHAQGATVNNSSMTAVQGNQYNYMQGNSNIVPQTTSLPAQHTNQGAAYDSSTGTPPPAQGAVGNNSPMTAVQGDQYTTYVQGDRNIVPQITKLLSKHIIQGAAHDSSARTPPPRCHPDTRVKLIIRIKAWFHGEGLRELLLWITGPAGIGKSAIVQTFAEYLTNSKSLGASVFISRPNKCNNPHGIFITIAYQLATRIEAYRNFVVEHLSLDPELLRGDMQAQFMTFIIEPFVKKGIGAGSKRWGILLDGLDELKGEDAQCSIIRLISNFVCEHPDVPLLWIIASRPESRISNTFDDDKVRRNHWSECIPIDSTEACEDVERFLRSSFKTIQKDFRDSVPSDWPSDTDFLQLTAAASGLFVYAEVVMQFIRDSDHADPAMQLTVLLSVINRSTAVPTEDNPFVHLDALYHEILSSIPSRLWPTVKRLFGFTFRKKRTLRARQPSIHFHMLRGMSILFNLNRHTIYTCLTKCRSTLKIPHWEAAHKEGLTFLHASFSDYLKDPSRSGDFYVGGEDNVEEGAILSLFEIWKKCSAVDIATASIESVWHQYCSKLDDGMPSKAVSTFHVKLFRDYVRWLGRVIHKTLETPTDSLMHVQLFKCRLDKLCYYFKAQELVDLVQYLQNSKNNRLGRTIVELRYLEFGHLDWQKMNPVSTYYGRVGRFAMETNWISNRPHSSAELEAFVAKLKRVQENSPELKVIIFGDVPAGRIAAFYHGGMYYVIPYPIISHY